MKRLSGQIKVLAIAFTLVAVGFAGTAVYAAYSGNDVAAHLASGAMTNSQCIGCHGQKAQERSLDLHTSTAHRRHLFSAFLRYQGEPDGCASCHASTDIIDGAGATVNRQVDVGTCVDCHGGFRASRHGNVNLAVSDPRRCTTAGCHAPGGDNDPAARHAAAGYVNNLFASSRAFCTKCHGGLALYAVEETN